MQVLKINQKKIRARIIKDHVIKSGYEGVICFSCGNASMELKNVGLNVIDISPGGELIANKWWPPDRIKKVFPLYFNATSGYLPLWMMYKVGKAMKLKIGDLDKKESYIIPTGSGETIISMRLVYNDIKFIARYNCGPGTKYEVKSPLNNIVKNLFNIQKWRINES